MEIVEKRGAPLHSCDGARHRAQGDPPRQPRFQSLLYGGPERAPLSQDLYNFEKGPDRFLYPPVTGILLVPFAFSSEWHVHQFVWHGLLGFFVFLLARGSWPALFAMMIVSRYLAINLGYGQINVAVLALVVGAHLALERRSRWAAPLWALASFVKVYPLAQGMEFLLRRRWRELGLAALAAALLLALPALVWGWDQSWRLHGDFLRALEGKGMPLHSHNQSISALLLRIFTKETFVLHAYGWTTWGFVELPPAAVRAAALLAGALATAWGWLRAHRRRLPLDYAAATAFSLLFLSHIVWKDYFLFLFLPLRQLIAEKPVRWKWWVGAYAAMVTLSAPDLLTHKITVWLDAWSIHFWAAIILWTAWLRIPPRTNNP
ncbi:MAG: DUF2029 domain-containing protein [Bdellovibrionales bacterium]|nr:DUF2029 domain-containing protein [Bdellovibrionales bacterium]